ncbi:DHH family phosphoesterase [Corynebacterium sp. H128]|uniref:DHH family phosphoesterase n=1 Tax=Corynebacterium sp. H128 TaxID=3133427 RepID=UPI0030949A50
MTTQAQFHAASSLVRSAEKIAVIGHIRPDADAIGSVCALTLALRGLGKEAGGWIGQSCPFGEDLLSIPGAHDITCAQDLPTADLVIVVDCGSIDRTGAFCQQLQEAALPVVMVDHHASNAGFGTVNLLDSAAESTTTILREWLADLGVALTKDIAHALYAGLVTDTGSFRWGRPSMHTLAGELVACGLDTREIAGELIDGISIAGLKMIGSVLGGIAVHQAGDLKVAVLIASHDLIAGRSTSEVESLVEYVRGLDNADLGAVLKEYHPGWFAVSLRTTRDLDVSLIAGALGGGGHLRAAGYTQEGTVEEVLGALLREATKVTLA